MVYFVLYMEKVQTGRVIEFYSNSCLIEINGQICSSPIMGKQDIVVGDYVYVKYQKHDDPKSIIITAKRDRISELNKKGLRNSKVIAANISHVGILTVENPKTSSEFIDKWIVSATTSNIKPFLINNKNDIKTSDEYKNKVQIYRDIDIPIFDISAKKGIGMNELKVFLEKKCTIFVGNSGAGKSTLSSKLTGKDIKTRPLSNNQGSHTTSVSSLYTLSNNIEISDSPGVRDISIEGLSKKEIIKGFFEIFKSSKLCKFSNCGHTNDAECDVIQKINNGEISKNRYNNFIKFLEQASDG